MARAKEKVRRDPANIRPDTPFPVVPRAATPDGLPVQTSKKFVACTFRADARMAIAVLGCTTQLAASSDDKEDAIRGNIASSFTSIRISLAVLARTMPLPFQPLPAEILGGKPLTITELKKVVQEDEDDRSHDDGDAGRALLPRDLKMRMVLRLFASQHSDMPLIPRGATPDMSTFPTTSI